MASSNVSRRLGSPSGCDVGARRYRSWRLAMSMLPKGQVSIMFQDDVTQVIPKGWIESMATRWSGQREKLAQDEDAAGSAQDSASKPRTRSSTVPANPAA